MSGPEELGGQYPEAPRYGFDGAYEERLAEFREASRGVPPLPRTSGLDVHIPRIPLDVPPLPGSPRIDTYVPDLPTPPGLPGVDITFPGAETPE